LMFMNVLQCTVLEVKVIDGLGHTVDVILVNGTLREGDTIVVSTLEGPVVTTIRGLLTPPPNKEMRVKSEYIHHKELTGAIGVKLVATDISRAVAGTSVLVKHADDDIEDIKDEVQSDLTEVFKALSTENKGVMVHASTLGALEALLQFLRDECSPPIPVCHINIGPIHKKDVMRANIMNERGLTEFATILAFDVKIDHDAQVMADEMHVRVFKADIIYHLFDQFSAYMNKITEERRKAAEATAVYPVVLKIMPQHIFNKKDPMVFGVEVSEGVLKIGTPLVIPSNDFLFIGNVIGIENNRKEVPQAKKGASVAVKISNASNPTMTYGRQFDHTGAIYSRISRESIDALKEFFKNDVAKEDWQLIIKMKKIFCIM
jgi:translation initiation factor 5B